jgi:hypothetical protein
MTYSNKYNIFEITYYDLMMSNTIVKRKRLL